MIYFIGGLDNREFKYFDILGKIRKENPGIEEYFFDGELKEEEKFLEKVSINSIFSGHELIVLKRAEKIKDMEKILDYICSLDLVNKEVVVDYYREDGKFGSKLLKKLEELKKNGMLEVFLYLKENDEDIIQYIAEELKISHEEAGSIFEMIGKNPFKIKNEVEKIRIYLNGENFNLKKLQNVISAEKEFKVYMVTENILMNNLEEILDYLQKTKEYMEVLYSLYGELEVMYKLSCLREKGMKFSTNYNTFKNQFEEIKEIFKSNNRVPNSYAVFKKLKKIDDYSNKDLKRLVYSCWETENNIKTGKIETESGVESLIMEVSSLYRKKN